MAEGVAGFGATRDELRCLLGKPDDVSVPSRRQREPMVWKYGAVEYHFGSDGRVCLIYKEAADGRPEVLAGPTGEAEA